MTSNDFILDEGWMIGANWLKNHNDGYDSNMCAKYDYAFDNKKTQSKRKRLNVPDEEDSDSNDFDFGSSK